MLQRIQTCSQKAAQLCYQVGIIFLRIKQPVFCWNRSHSMYYFIARICPITHAIFPLQDVNNLGILASSRPLDLQ